MKRQVSKSSHSVEKEKTGSKTERKENTMNKEAENRGVVDLNQMAPITVKDSIDHFIKNRLNALIIYTASVVLVSIQMMALYSTLKITKRYKIVPSRANILRASIVCKIGLGIVQCITVLYSSIAENTSYLETKGERAISGLLKFFISFISAAAMCSILILIMNRLAPPYAGMCMLPMNITTIYAVFSVLSRAQNSIHAKIVENSYKREKERKDAPVSNRYFLWASFLFVPITGSMLYISGLLIYRAFSFSFRECTANTFLEI